MYPLLETFSILPDLILQIVFHFWYKSQEKLTSKKDNIVFYKYPGIGTLLYVTEYGFWNMEYGLFSKK